MSNPMETSATTARGGYMLNTMESSRLPALVDVMKVLPSIVWLIVCLAAMPIYAGMAWRTPIACAVLSSGIAMLSTYDIVRYQRRQEYLMFGAAVKPQLQRSRFAEIKLCVAGVLTAVCLSLTISFLSVGYSLPAPTVQADGCGYGNFRPTGPKGWEKNPCAECASRDSCLEKQVYSKELGFACNSTCVEIRDAWAASVASTNPAAMNLCPPPPPTIDTVVAYSCKADGFWMMVTCVVSMIWTVSLWILRKRSAASGDMISIMTPFFGSNRRDSAEVKDNAGFDADAADMSESI
jgi:hypothetical protein